MTYDDVRKIALKLPGVEEGTSYGTPALKLKKKLLVRLREEGNVIVLAMPFDQREALMAEDPETYFITDHYLNYEYVLVRLTMVAEDAMCDLLKAACRVLSSKKEKAAGPRRR